MSSQLATTPLNRKPHQAISQSSLNERCPSCDRAFGPKAFDRHVEWCREHKTRIHKSPANIQQAKERLEARIKYKVPPLRQSKRSTIREKYSPGTQPNPPLFSSCNILAGKSTSSLTPSSTMSTSTTRKKLTCNTSEKIHKKETKEQDSRSRFDKRIGDCSETKESVKSENTISKSFQTKRNIPTKKINNTAVNSGLQGITVSSLSIKKDQNLITWKDTTPTSSEILSVLSHGNGKNMASKTDIRDKKSKSKMVIKQKAVAPAEGLLDAFYRKKKIIPPKLIVEVPPSQKVPIRNINKAISRRIMEFKMKKEALKNANLEQISKEQREASGLSHISEEYKPKKEFENEAESSVTRGPRGQELEELDAIAELADVNADTESVIELKRSYEDHSNSADLPDNVDYFEGFSENGSTYSVSSNSKRFEELENGSRSEPVKATDVSNVPSEIEEEISWTSLKPDSAVEPEANTGLSGKMRLLRLKAFKKNEDLRFLELDRGSSLELIGDAKMDIEKIFCLEGSNAKMESSNDDLIAEYLSGKGNSCEKPDTAESDGEHSSAETVLLGTDDRRDRDGKPRSPSKKTASKIAIQTRIWKRRTKLKKCRMCVKCFSKKLRSLKKLNSCSQQEPTDSESSEHVKESLELVDISKNASLQEVRTKSESFEDLPDDFVAMNPSIRRSKSANYSVPENEDEVPAEMEGTSRSLPNVTTDRLEILELAANEWIKDAGTTYSSDNRLDPDNSVDSVVPKKRRKITASLLGSSKITIDKQVDDLTTNINKIKEKKYHPPLILDYSKTNRTTEKKTATDILYINKIYCSHNTPEFSELESGNENPDDGIQDIDDDELQTWESEINMPIYTEHLDRTQSPMKTNLPKGQSSPEIRATGNLTGKSAFVADGRFNADERLSSGTLKHSAYNLNQRQDAEAKSSEIISSAVSDSQLDQIDDMHFPPLKVFSTEQQDDSFQTTLSEASASYRSSRNESREKESPSTGDLPKTDTIPCRLPRIPWLIKQRNKVSEEPSDKPVKLPAIDLRDSKTRSEGTELVNSKLIQVPSQVRKIGTSSFCQQTSRPSLENGLSVCTIELDSSVSYIDIKTNRTRGGSDKDSNKTKSTCILPKMPNLKYTEEMKNYLNDQKDRPEEFKEETDGTGAILKAEELFSVDDEMYEEYKKYEEMYLKEKNKKFSSRKQKKKVSNFGITIEDKANKVCADSAYGSLNRKDPPEKANEIVPPEELETDEKTAISAGGRMSKFCHECGNKYPLCSAKFCVECGVKRLAL